MVINIEKYQKNCEYTRDIKELVIGRKQFKTYVEIKLQNIPEKAQKSFEVDYFSSFARD